MQAGGNLADCQIVYLPTTPALRTATQEVFRLFMLLTSPICIVIGRGGEDAAKTEVQYIQEATREKRCNEHKNNYREGEEESEEEEEEKTHTHSKKKRRYSKKSSQEAFLRP